MTDAAAQPLASNGAKLRHVELSFDEAAGRFLARYRDPGRGGHFVTPLVAEAELAGRFARVLDELVESYALEARRGREAFPKLPNVSFYAVRTPGGKLRHRVSYTIPGYARRTDRLGSDPRKAYKFAETVSDTMEMVKSRLMKPADAFRRLCVDRRPISVHVDAYEQHLRTQGVDPDYRATTVRRLRECVKLGSITRFDHITRAAVASLLKQLRDVEKREGSGQKIKAKTVNYYLKALKQFTRWMAKEGRATEDPLQYVEGVKTGGEEERRRDATLEDVKALYASAMADTFKRRGSFGGPDRAMLYLFAFCTGLRADEIRQADVSWLRLALDEPVIIVGGDATKNENRAVQPLPKWLASALSSWLAGRARGRLFPNMPQSMSGPFARDRARARKAYLEQEGLDAAERKRRQESDFLKAETHDGKLVFHSFRHGFASALLDTDAESKLVQSLVRHSTITLLFDRYGHARKNKLHQAVERAMPNLLAKPGAAPERAGTAQNERQGGKKRKKAQRTAQRNSASVSG